MPVLTLINQSLNQCIQTTTTLTLTPLLYACLLFGGYISMIFIHELGHYLILRKYTDNAKIYFYMIGLRSFVHVGQEEDYKLLTPQEKINVYVTGILLGGIVPVLFIFAHWGTFPLLIVYAFGVHADIQKIKRNLKQEVRE